MRPRPTLSSTRTTRRASTRPASNLTLMRLQSLELRRIRMPLVAPFETSFGVQYERDILLLKATTSDGEGWGECVAGEEPTYSPEYVDGAQQVIAQHLVPRL